MKKKIGTILKTMLILFLAGLVIIMMVEIRKIQGTAKVVNYAGLVRGATQREVKLEIAGNANDDLMAYLDDILDGLKYGDGVYDLARLPDSTYQNGLDRQIEYWTKLKSEIISAREKGYKNTDVLGMSETYFKMADKTVSAAENYSERVAGIIRIVETLSVADIIMIVMLIIQQTIAGIRIKNSNKILEKKAYIDLQTGLPNKSKCEEMLHDYEYISEPVGFVMFDLNNLKRTNDTYGHAVGDQLITNFARLLRNAIPSKDFVGRYGGDEFIAIITQTTKQEILLIMEEVHSTVKHFNENIHKVEVSYAYGYAFSEDYSECTMKTLFNKADKHMYENKAIEKAEINAAD
ncbi:GGDEF domain-containing protein [Butyribacter intestini]|uniref:GGDEF domain-containing protein n=1 Tax=Butyribacter intestini TaxID=1703332 RepID=UPI0022E6DE52|nr:GGDEF domain-containing protein [Butyribacter intestini]